MKITIRRPCTKYTVNAADFGIQEGAEGDNTKAFRKALEYCRKEGAAKLVVPKGVYYFKSCEEDTYLSLDRYGRLHSGRK